MRDLLRLSMCTDGLGSVKVKGALTQVTSFLPHFYAYAQHIYNIYLGISNS